MVRTEKGSVNGEGYRWSYKFDSNGNLIKPKTHSNLEHRQIAYKEIYLKNREKYPLPFSKYVIHHKDMNKLNNNVFNLEILTQESHQELHFGKSSISYYDVVLFLGKILFFIVIFLLILYYFMR